MTQEKWSKMKSNGEKQSKNVKKNSLQERWFVLL
jgi:hypothetical protein